MERKQNLLIARKFKCEQTHVITENFNETGFTAKFGQRTDHIRTMSPEQTFEMEN